MIQILHEGRHPGADGAEIVVVQLLTLGGLSTEEGASRQAQILPLGVQILGQEEILLLGTDTGNDTLGLGVAEEPQDPQSLPGHLVHGAQQRGLLVQGLAGVGEEAGGNIQASVPDEGKGGGIPGGIAPCLKGGTQTAGGEAGGIRLAPNQLLAGKFHNHPTVSRGRNEGIMLLRGDARHRLEPVGVVSGSLLQRPLLHGLGNFIGYVQGQPLSLRHAVLPGLIGLQGQPLLHGCLVKNILAELLRQIENLFHRCTSFPADRIAIHCMIRFYPGIVKKARRDCAVKTIPIFPGVCAFHLIVPYPCPKMNF